MGLLTGGRDMAIPQGLLDPMRVKALREQAARAPMNNARTPQVVARAPTGYAQNPNNGLAQGMASVGQVLGAIGKQRQAAAAQEKQDLAKARVGALLTGDNIKGEKFDQRNPAHVQMVYEAYGPEQAKAIIASVTPEKGEMATYYGPNGGEQQAIPGSERAQMLKAADYSLNKPKAPIDPNKPFNPDGTPNEEFQEYQRRLRTAGRPQNTVTVETPELGALETEEQKTEGKNLATRANEVINAGEVAVKEINNIDMALQIAEPQNGEQLPSVLQDKAGAALVALGFDPDSELFRPLLGNITSGQSFMAIMKNAILTKMQAQSGPQTKSDTDMIAQTVAGLGNTPEARQFLLRSAKALAQKDVDRAKFYADFFDQNKTYRGARKAWFESQKGMPLFGKNPNSNIPVFYAEFRDAVLNHPKNQGRDISEADLRAEWKRKYGRR